jgi:MFS family permease
LPTLRENLRALPRATWILFLGTFINRFGTFVMPFLTLYLVREGYSATRAGVAVSAYGGGHLVASMLGGHLADRFGRRNTIALSMFSSALAMVALSQTRGYFAILGITFLAGLAAELYRPATGALIGDLVPPELRVTAFGVYRLAVNLGFTAGPATAGFLADRSFVWLFLVDAGTSAVYGVIALAFLPHGLRTAKHEEKHADGAVRHAMRNTPFLMFLVATACIMFIEFQLHSVLPLHLKARGYTAFTYGKLMSINAIMIVLFELALTGWSQRHNPRHLISAGYFLTAIGYAFSGLAESVAAMAACVVIWTIGEMIYAPVTGAYVTNLAPDMYRGRYHGMWVFTWSIGMILGPILGTLMYQRNANGYWVVCALIGCVAAAFAGGRSIWSAAARRRT